MTVFSVITVTKDNAAGLARTEASVKAQTFTDYEWIVIDGAVEADAGIYDAMNKGIERARGDYLVFMNAGDTFAGPSSLQSIHDRLGADFLYGDAVEDGRVKPARHAITRGMMTHHQAMLYRRAVIGDLRYDTGYQIAADYKFTAQFLQRAMSTQYVPLPLCVFESGGVSQVKATLGRTEQACIRRELGIYAPLIQMAQRAATALKRYAPGLYWMLRTSKQVSRRPTGFQG